MKSARGIGRASLALCGLVAMASSAQASVIATENFAGSSGGLSAAANNNGGTGWTSAWTAGSVDGTMTAGLGAPTTPTAYSYVPSANAAKFTGASGNASDDRFFSSAPITTGTLYFSFLANVQSPASSTREVGFSLLGNGTDVVNMVDYGTGNAASDYWNLQKGNVTGSLVTNNTSAVSLNTTYLIVMAFNFGSGAGTGTINLYVNPDSSTDPATPSATITGATFPTGVNEIGTFAGSGTVGSSNGSIILDEFRIGTTYADVVPEPCSALLILAPAAGSLMSRRRRTA